VGSKSEALAAQFEEAVAALVRTVESCADAHWQATCGDEQWTVAATAHHVGAQWPLELEYITAAAEGRTSPTYTWDDINAKNAKHAAEFAACTRAEVAKLLRDESPSIAAYLRKLSDEQLARTMSLPLANGASVSTEQLILGGVLIEHATAHLKSIVAAG